MAPWYRASRKDPEPISSSHGWDEDIPFDGPKTVPVKGLKSDYVHDGVMALDGHTDSIAASLEQQNLNDDIAESTIPSLQNNPGSAARVPNLKRNKDDMSDIDNSYHAKRGRASPKGSEVQSSDEESPNIKSHPQDPEQPPATLVRDLETREITMPQLIQEVKGIYAGLVMVEKKCFEIISEQAQKPTKLSKDQWQALIALHRTLLNEHHDSWISSCAAQHAAQQRFRLAAHSTAIARRR